MKLTYRSTVNACFTGYIVQAIIINYISLLFLTFNEGFGVSLAQIALLVTINFTVQLTVDLICALILDKTGWRIPIVLAHLLAASGLVCLAVLPQIMADKFTALLIPVIICACGGGLLEVLVSPIVEACPSDNKAGSMSLLHSFYCWGYCGVVIISTLFFAVFGIENWHILAIIWAIIPFLNAFLFMFVPLGEPEKEEKESFSLKNLLSNKLFWVLIVIMFCAAASEQAVSQWASAFTEKALNISKATGDLLGTLMFAVFMGISRLLHAKYCSKLRISLEKTIFLSGLLCVSSYLIISLSPIPMISLIGIGICGFSVGILWPGSFSLGAAKIKGGTAMFALLALFGDFGCGMGPFVVGNVASACNDSLKAGTLVSAIFPLLMCVCLIAFFKNNKKTK